METEGNRRILWIIRWTDQQPQKMECMTCTREEAEQYARQKSAKEKLGRYVIA